MGFDGVEIGPLGMGHSNMTTDGANGAYIYYSSGNGAGAALYCMHIDEYAGELWADWVNVTAGTTGLAYQFSGIGDDAGGLAIRFDHDAFEIHCLPRAVDAAIGEEKRASFALLRRLAVAAQVPTIIRA